MKFNVEKCKVVHYGKRSIHVEYNLYGQPLEEVVSEKDLGVVFSNDLKVRRQCEEAYSKASQMLGLINCRTIQFKNPEVLLPLYKSVVRPQLEYCSAVWSPQYVQDKALLEKVQHRFSRMFHDLSLPYEQRLDKLGIWTLEEHRNRADLLKVFKLIKGFTAVSWTPELKIVLPGVIIRN